MTEIRASYSEPSLGLAARRGFLWQACAFVLARLTLLASTVILARMLGPAQYGVVALALVIVLALNVISDFGVSQALVYLPKSDRRIDAALGTALLGSCAFALAWIAVAPVLAGWLGDADAGPMFQTLALVLVFTSLGQVPDAVLRKDLQFSRRLPGELARGLGRGVVVIVLAFAGLGAWSLVWAEIIGAGAYMVVSWTMLAHRPGPPREWLRRYDVRALLGFGVPAAANGALATLVLNVDYLIVASTLGTAALGFYFIGFRIPELLILSVFQVFSQVTYPLYTKVQHQPERLARAYLLSLRVQSVYGLSVGVAVAVASPSLVPVLFGDRWLQAVPVMQAIACYAVFRSLAAGAVDLFKAVGRPEMGVWLGLVRLLALVPVLFLATRWGVPGVAVGQAVMALLFGVATQGIVCRVIKISVRDLAAAVLPGLVIGAATGTGTFAGLLIFRGDPWLTLIAAGVGALVAGLVALLLVDRSLLKNVVGR